jgi:hypothetical protein
MRLIVDLCHPAHIHLFKNLIWKLKEKGHDVLIITRDKEMLIQLLQSYNFDFIQLTKPGKSQIGLVIEMIERDVQLYSLCKKYKPDMMIGISENVAHIGKILNIPSITFTDTEHATLSHLLMTPFSDVVCTPSCFKKNFGAHQVRYNGYHELAYLHPNWFTPDPAVLEEANLTQGKPYIIMRFVSWQASHDVGQHGIRDKVGLVKALVPYGRILITSEGPLPPELEEYRIRVSPEKLHDLLNYATLYIGEGATTASECALLGTHAIYVNTLRLGYIDEEEQKYGLVYTFSDPLEMESGVFNKAQELLNEPDLKEKGKRKAQKLLDDKIDVTAFFIWFIENYPGSVKRMKEEPGIQEQFKTV